jgi:dTDP-4-dehydrorhamnose 3,5-epimerase-like enzyme
MSLINLIDFKSLGDERGSLVALESNKNIPFAIKRVYYIFATETGVARGFHAHKKLKQVAICVQGSCEFILDDGCERQHVVLDSPIKGLYIDSMKWREMHHFSDDCVLVVLASEHYSETDYIRDYNDFLKMVDTNK